MKTIRFQSVRHNTIERNSLEYIANVELTNQGSGSEAIIYTQRKQIQA